MRSFLLAAVALATAALSPLGDGPAHAGVLLNEAFINPPGADDAREYVEIRAGVGESLAGVWLLEIEGDTTGPGVVEHALDLSAVATGSNGLVLLGHNYATSVPWPAVPSGTTRFNLGRKPSSTIENGSVTLLLVRAFAGAVGNDLDPNDDGVLDATPWGEVLDGVAWIDGASGRAYSPAVVTIAGGVLDAVTRFPGDDTGSAASAWYAGDVLASGATPDLSTAYDPAHASANFPGPPAYVSAGALTPGAANVPALVANPVCGDGVVEGGEGCDDGNALDGDCCSSACALEPAGSVCRPAAGACDLAEACDGVSAPCPPDGFAASGAGCRAAAGECDVAESCDGMSAPCPADGFVSSGSACRDAAGECDVAESCDGASAACPADGFASSGTGCRASVGECDIAEACDGASAACPVDGFVSSGTVCRAAATECDVAETCNGTSAGCPDDADSPDGAFCDDGDSCTAADRCAAGACVGDRSPDCDLGPFLCHKAAPAKAPRGTPPFPAFAKRSGDVVVDAFASTAPEDRHQLDLLTPIASCAAMGTGVADATHLHAYVAKLTKTDPRQPKPVKTVHTLENAVGRLRVRIDGVAHVFSPAAFALGAGGAPPLEVGLLDHFKCYKVSVAREAGNQFEPTTIALDDPLAGGSRVLDLLGTSHLCAPASLNGGDPSAPDHAQHLLCYKARLAKLDPPQRKDAKVRLSVSTTFGSEVVDAGKLAGVCLPSVRLD